MTFMVVSVQRESASSRRIELLDEHEQPCFVGTGFVVEDAGRSFLVSNRHVFTGRDPQNNFLTDGARTPVTLRVTFPTADGSTHVAYAWPLFEGEQSTWLQHPSGKHVDVAAMRIDLPPDVAMLPVPTDGRMNYADMRLLPRIPAGGQLFVVGYPFGADGGSPVLGIWVGATIATEPGVDLHGAARFMVDGATREGLSGAPVYAYVPAGGFARFDDPATDVAGTVLMEPGSALIGIYSGRLRDDAQLGYVWKLPSILDVVRRGERINLVTDIFG